MLRLCSYTTGIPRAPVGRLNHLTTTIPFVLTLLTHDKLFVLCLREMCDVLDGQLMFRHMLRQLGDIYIFVVSGEQRDFSTPSYDEVSVEPSSTVVSTLDVQQDTDMPPYNSDCFHATVDSDDSSREVCAVPEEQRDFTMPSYDDILLSPAVQACSTLDFQQATDVSSCSNDYFHATADSETFGTAAELSAFTTVQ